MGYLLSFKLPAEKFISNQIEVHTVGSEIQTPEYPIHITVTQGFWSNLGRFLPWYLGPVKSTIDTLKKDTLLASNPSSFWYVNVPSLR